MNHFGEDSFFMLKMLILDMITGHTNSKKLSVFADG